MNVTKVNNNIYRLTVFRVMNCYLVKEADGFTLIDALSAGQADKIMAAAQDLGAPIRRIGLTHAHVDHVGSLQDLVDKGQYEVFCSAQSADFMTGNMTLRPDQPQDKIRGGFVQTTVKPAKLLEEGDMLGSLRVVAAPGHSPDHIAFFDERDGTLIAGDAFQTQGGVAVAGVFKLGFPLPAFATWHKETAVNTAKKLLALNPTRLAVGHGRVLENPAAMMKDAIAVAKRKL